MKLEEARRAVVTVGNARGFIVQGLSQRYIITAGHCLPFFPPCTSFSYPHERAYKSLLGPVGAEPTVWAECRFLDPIGDLAVLSAVDQQEMHAQWAAYSELVEAQSALIVSDPTDQVDAIVLSLDDRWLTCSIRHSGTGPLWIENATGKIVRGMSGSPFIAADGSAIGVLCTSTDGPGNAHAAGGPNPRLATNLPGWLLRDLGAGAH